MIRSLYTWNVNGIRACARKGFCEWLAKAQPDILAIQESRAGGIALGPEIMEPSGYQSFWEHGDRKGYSGVAFYTRIKPTAVYPGLGIAHFDHEGRVIRADWGSVSVLNAYFPHTREDHSRLEFKLEFCTALAQYCQSLMKEGRSVFLVGDYNIAHEAIDLARPDANEASAGYLPQERAFMGAFLRLGYVDLFRHFVKDRDHYTWWSARSGARARNIGWRIDYICSSVNMLSCVKEAFICNDIMGSDHCPVGVIFSEELDRHCFPD